MEQLRAELENIKRNYKSIRNVTLTDDQAFEYLCAYFFHFSEKGAFEENIFDIEEIITNGSNDGGIDFVFFDDENFKIICAQCKYSNNFTLNDLISELNKMSTTYLNFKKFKTGMYNNKLKNVLQNAIDRLPDDNDGNIQYVIFSITNSDKENIERKIKTENNVYDTENVTVIGLEEIILRIDEVTKKTNTVKNFKVKIDLPNNYLQYNNIDVSGIMVNLSSNSLTQMYNKFKDDGLLDLNIRKFIPNKIVDEGIEKTLDSDRENFWFLNNVLIIACESYRIDGNTIDIESFSIVNGGQTTYKIGNYKGKNNDEFYIPCKIIEINPAKKYLYSKIAESTNSQKPITQRDLKSNAPEMKKLQNWLKTEKIFLDIKRGVKPEKNKYNYKIKNDELGQCILSFVYQQPGTARSGKKIIFDNDTYYKKLFKLNYEKDLNKKEFIIDLICLHKYYIEIEQKLKANSILTIDQKIILSNAKFIIFAIYGFMYMIENNDITTSEITLDSNNLILSSFTYSKFISNYQNDDLLDKLENLTIQIVYALEGAYENAKIQEVTTSVSNLFKTDKKYKEIIIKQLIQIMNIQVYQSTYKEGMKLFNRNLL
ncbi:AIPR family protein [Anaerorhabdus furcosa]|uniref:AIPR protein n=1 Tax=Anaerorhabdus furcosa TaxID=118967 RepID=A0A1T4MJ13_9FIRM|nr:AIPR family protein [Anaerorhabdus furcosa]SJZ66826.1 AIPR protein [Anaerorhabdus furcosa]